LSTQWCIPILFRYLPTRKGRQIRKDIEKALKELHGGRHIEKDELDERN